MMKRFEKGGFTLIEVLAAMAVLMIIVLMLTRVFRDATSAWTIGTRQIEDNVNGRAVLDFVARDIATAIAGETNCVFYLKSSGKPPKWPNDELSFVSLTGNPSSGGRETRQVIYFVTNMTDRSDKKLPYRWCLKRIQKSVDTTNAVNCYTKKDWWTSVKFEIEQARVVADNVNLFLVGCAGATNDALGKADYFHGLFDYNTMGDVGLMQSDYIWYTKSDAVPFMKGKLPVRIDLYLELLGEDAAVKVAQLRSAGLTAQADALVSQSVRKYMTRVYFSNRNGYAVDRTP